MIATTINPNDPRERNDLPETADTVPDNSYTETANDDADESDENLEETEDMDDLEDEE